MKRFVSVIALVLLTAVSLFAGQLRSYRFSDQMHPTADPVYAGDPILKEILFQGFAGENAILNGASLYEVVQNVNTEFVKQFMRYGMKVYDFKLSSSFRSSLDSRSQEGTLNIDSVASGSESQYSVNALSSVSTVICGNIEYFKFNQSLDSSYIALTLKVYNRDNGYYYWVTTITGKFRDVLDYVCDALTHTPVDNSVTLRRDSTAAAVQQEIASRLPQITFSVNPAEVVVKDPAHVPGVKFNIQISSRYTITEWNLTIYDSSTNVVKKFEGTGLPSSMSWDLVGDNGNAVPTGATYTAIITVADELNNKVSQPLDLKVSAAAQ